MNIQQFKKVTQFKNWLRFASESMVYIISIMVSIIGRTTMNILLALANGYVGSLAFADIAFPRFMRAVMSADHSLSKGMAEHIAHSQAHWAGIVIMLFLDACIFIFGFVPKIRDSEGRVIDLEPYSLAMAIFSALLGTAGFIGGIESDTWGWKDIMNILFMFFFASVAPILMYINTKYQKAADGGIVAEVISWVISEVKKNLANTDNVTTLPTRKASAQQAQASAQRPPIKTEAGTILNFDDFLKSDN